MYVRYSVYLASSASWLWLACRCSWVGNWSNFGDDHCSRMIFVRSKQVRGFAKNFGRVIISHSILLCSVAYFCTAERILIRKNVERISTSVFFCICSSSSFLEIHIYYSLDYICLSSPQGPRTLSFPPRAASLLLR